MRSLILSSLLCLNIAQADFPCNLALAAQNRILYSRLSFRNSEGLNEIPEHVAKEIRSKIKFYFPDAKDAEAAEEFFNSGGVFTLSQGAYFTFDADLEKPVIALSSAQMAALKSGEFSFGLMDAVDTFRHELKHFQDWKEKKAELEKAGVEDPALKAQEFFSTGKGRELTEKNAVGAGYRALKNLIIGNADYRKWLEKESEGKIVFPTDQGINHFAQNFILGSSTYPESEGLRLELHSADEDGFKLEVEAADKRSAWTETEKNKSSTPEAIKKREEEYKESLQKFNEFKEAHKGRMLEIMREAVLKTIAYKKAFLKYYRRVKADGSLTPKALERIDNIYEYLKRSTNINLITSGSGMASLIFAPGKPESRFSSPHISRLQSVYDDALSGILKTSTDPEIKAYLDTMPNP